MKLGKLEKVKDLRSVWKHEANDFTKWLAKEENLATLGDEIGIDIELRSTEAKTGSFSTDILAVEANTDNKIIIENQLEQTNHDHLGKIITYASGHDAKTIIWIVKRCKQLLVSLFLCGNLYLTGYRSRIFCKSFRRGEK